MAWSRWTCEVARGPSTRLRKPKNRPRGFALESPESNSLITTNRLSRSFFVHRNQRKAGNRPRIYASSKAPRANQRQASQEEARQRRRWSTLSLTPTLAKHSKAPFSRHFRAFRAFSSTQDTPTMGIEDKRGLEITRKTRKRRQSCAFSTAKRTFALFPRPFRVQNARRTVPSLQQR